MWGNEQGSVGELVFLFLSFFIFYHPLRPVCLTRLGFSVSPRHVGSVPSVSGWPVDLGHKREGNSPSTFCFRIVFRVWLDVVWRNVNVCKLQFSEMIQWVKPYRTLRNIWGSLCYLFLFSFFFYKWNICIFNFAFLFEHRVTGYATWSSCIANRKKKVSLHMHVKMTAYRLERSR